MIFEIETLMANLDVIQECKYVNYVPPSQWGWTYYFCFFPASGRLVSAHLKEKYLSYLYQIWYGCLLG